MDIIISKQEVFSEVEKRSSLEGFVNAEAFDKAWANESRGELLDSYWIEGYTAVIQLLKKYLSSDSVSYSLNAFNKNETLNISVAMPQRYEAKLDGSIQTDVKMMIVCNVLTGWLGVVMPESAGKYEEESKGYSEDLRVKLLYRKAPTDKVNTPKVDSETMQGGEAELSTPKVDGVSLVQGWDGCPVCGRYHCE